MDGWKEFGIKKEKKDGEKKDGGNVERRNVRKEGRKEGKGAKLLSLS